jgi:hypothetical protein
MKNEEFAAALKCPVYSQDSFKFFTKRQIILKFNNLSKSKNEHAG